MKKSKIGILLVVIFGLIALSYLLVGSLSTLPDVPEFLLNLKRTIIISQNPERYATPYSCIDCNVILFVVDTLRADRLGSYGYSRNTSPNIDALSTTGVLFKNAFSQTPNTLSSTMSILTSLYPTEHKVISQYDDALDPSIKTLIEIIKGYNYKTAWFAPTDTPHLNLSKGFGRGVDDFYGDLNEPDGWNEFYDWMGDNREEKFFAFLHTSKAHDPYIVPSPFDTLYDENYEGSIIGEREEFIAEFLKTYPIDFKPISSEEVFEMVRDFYWQFVDTSDEKDIAHLNALYDAAITCCVDPYVGEFMDKLREYDIDKKTIVIITSDHGEAFGEHGNFLHSNLYYEDLSIPLIFTIPQKEGKIIDSQVQSIDIMPTILDIIGIPLAGNTQGQSLLPLMLGQIESVNEYTYGYWKDAFSIRSAEWKLIRYNNGDVELYNIKDDPREQFNIAEQYADIVKEMKNKLSDFETSSN